MKFKTIGPVPPGDVIQAEYANGRVGGHGDYGAVFLNGKRLPLKPSQKVANHSPDGFAWGYAGSGPTQLALALLLAKRVPPQMTNTLKGRFRDQFIAPLPNQQSFLIRVDITKWVDEQIALAGREGRIV